MLQIIRHTYVPRSGMAGELTTLATSTKIICPSYHLKNEEQKPSIARHGDFKSNFALISNPTHMDNECCSKFYFVALSDNKSQCINLMEASLIDNQA